MHESCQMEDVKAPIENRAIVSLLDVKRRILYASSLSTSLLGYRPEELLGRNSFDMIHTEAKLYSLRALRQVLLKPPGLRETEARLQSKDGRWCRVESTVSNLLAEPRVGAIS